MKHFYILAAALLCLCSCAKEQDVKLIPYPNEVSVKSGEFVAAGADINYDIEDELTVNAINAFAQQLGFVSGKESSVNPGSGKGFVFTADATLAAEEYEIHVRKQKVEVKASTFNGFNYALQTLRQLLPVEIYGSEPAPEMKWTIQCIDIKDAPRFAYRALMMDVARHFFTVDEVKHFIDIAELHKMNTLHWHLTDDQGWRIEIKKYPRLTSVGSMRKATVVAKNWDEYDGVPHGGYYTQEQIKEVVEYARTKGITIIPEIDLPGHMLAALAAYPELGCTGGPYEVWGRWGVADDVLCVGKEKTMLFLEDVLSEVCELFPSEYIHIGGDECPKVRWEKCPTCQAKIKELGLKDDDKFKAEHYLQSYVTARMEKFLSTKGKKIIGWDEILEGELSPNATVMSWRGSEGGIAAANSGHDAIMVPNSHFYFDYYQSRDIDNEPFGIGGYIPVDKVYSYEPFTKDLAEENRGHILGIQANLWAEYIATEDHIQYMLLPRTAALSEVQWTMPEHKNWDRFLDALPHMIAIYDQLGYNYAKTIYNVQGLVSVNDKKNCVSVELSTLGHDPIRYTLDGSEPDENSCLYTGPVEIYEGCTLKAVALRDSYKARAYVQEFVENKALGRPITLNTDPLPKYRYGAPGSLVDGVRGIFSYATGPWVGWLGTPIDVTIDMGGKNYSKVILGTMVQKGEDIFNPLDLVVLTSDNNVDFTEIGRIEMAVEGPDDPDGLKEYTVEFPETSAKYLRVTSKTLECIPDWHGGRGRKGFTFADEIIVL